MLVVSSVVLDLSWVFQFIATSFLIILCFSLFIIKTSYFTNYFNTMQEHEHEQEKEKVVLCVVCGKGSEKQCSACKLVKYCSAACQRSHWNSGHKTECKKFQLVGIRNLKQSTSVQNGRKRTVSLVAGGVLSSNIKRPKEILFPYEDFMELYNWDDAKFRPCGLLNCGNSCFANAVLQCLSHTRPLVAYLLEKSHRKECRRNDWCFLCEFQTHIERASSSRQPFSPLNILSRLPNIGSNFGYGKQEDAHEFMRFAIDTMQSVFLDEFGGEKVLHPSTQETTLIQHIFGGHLQSQVVCSVCLNVSNQCENVMDLTVEINGDAASLEECLDQFTAREQLHGDNLYKCDGCNDYVMAWKRLMIRRAPNILTIALKRFQSGRFGKLNKKVTFPETLDLTPYMTEERDGNDIYKLYAVVVHVDMLNASFFGHYICYTKDFCGNWYRIDDCKVSKVDLQDVLSEGAYMLLYNRISPRPSCLKPIGSSSKKEQQTVRAVQEEEQSVASLARAESSHSFSTSGSIEVQPNNSVETDLLSKKSVSKDVEMADFISSPSSSEDMDVSSCQYSKPENEIALSSLCTEIENQQRVGISNNVLTSSFTENLQCTEDGDKVESDQNHDDSSCQDFIASPSSPQDMDVSSCHGIEPEKEIASSSLRTEAGNLPKVEISNDVLMCSSTENLQSSGDSDIVESEQNYGSSNKLSQSVDSKRELDKMETEKGFPLSSGAKVAVIKSVDGKNLKPFLTPGFLEKNASKNPMERREKGPYNGGDSSQQKEIASSSLRTEVGNLQKVEISNDVLMCSSTENSQCSEDGDRVDSEQNHGSSNKLSQSVDSKRERDNMQTEKEFPLSSEGKIAVRKSINGKKLKPLFTPGFLGNNSSKNSMERREKGLSSEGDSSHQTEPSLIHESVANT